jgi:hypothetical protein
MDRALVVVSVDLGAGEPFPGASTGPRLRQYTDDVEQKSAFRYFVTALRTTVTSVAAPSLQRPDSQDTVRSTTQRCRPSRWGGFDALAGDAVPDASGGQPAS